MKAKWMKVWTSGQSAGHTVVDLLPLESSWNQFHCKVKILFPTFQYWKKPVGFV